MFVCVCVREREKERKREREREREQSESGGVKSKASFDTSYCFISTMVFFN